MTSVDILAIGVHPDDIELSCSGTLLKHIDLGKTVGLLDLTRGELGTRGNAEIRTEEARASALKMGALFREQLTFKDGFFANDEEHVLPIIRVLRKCTPEVVLINAVSDRHPDHGRAARLAADACFLSGLAKIETDAPKWRPRAVYHYNQDYFKEPDFVVDISNYMDAKLEVIKCFKSQFYDPNSAEPESPISTQAFMEYVKAQSRIFGRPAGFEFGEGFQSARYIGVKNLFDLA